MGLGPWPLVSDHSGPRPTLTRRKHPLPLPVPPAPVPIFFSFLGLWLLLWPCLWPRLRAAASSAPSFFLGPARFLSGFSPRISVQRFPLAREGTAWDRIPAGIPAGSLWAPLGPLQRHKLHHFFWLQLSHSVLRFSLGMDMQLGMEMGMKRAGQGIAIAMAIAITTTVLCYAILYYTILYYSPCRCPCRCPCSSEIVLPMHGPVDLM